MKCAFCGTTHEVEDRDGMLLCDDCHQASIEAKRRNREEEIVPEIIEVEDYTVKEEVEEAPTVGVRCEITVGVTTNGELYFNVAGDNTDLLTIDGLIAFAKRRMKQVWEQREAAMAQQ